MKHNGAASDCFAQQIKLTAKFRAKQVTAGNGRDHLHFKLDVKGTQFFREAGINCCLTT
jgi:hypothetical protein